MTETLAGGRTPFDHIAVAFSMVMAIAVVRLLDGLRPALATRAGWWVHATWVLQKLAGVALSWWVFWWLRGPVAWTAASFLWVLLAPALVLLQATALVTTDPGAVQDWRTHFFGIRRWFFSTEAAFVLHSAVTSTVLRGVPLWDPLRLVQGAALVSAALGIRTASPRLHAVLAPLALGVQVLGLAWCFFRP